MSKIKQTNQNNEATPIAEAGKKQTTMLVILDGFGCAPDDSNPRSNAIASANTPCLDSLIESYPHTTLGASGESVGLPPGQMGNSEVGHLNIGAGRIVYQELTRITNDIRTKHFFENTVLKSAIHQANTQNSALHIMGLLSDGGVHSHIEHLLALIDMAKSEGIKKLYVHCFLDGRDVPPRCAQKYIEILESHMADIGLGQIASICGRYYAMDRDNRWDRVSKAYEALTEGKGQIADSASAALQNAYTRDENDEFVLPTVITKTSAGVNFPSKNADASNAVAVPVGLISDNDSIIMFNFRPDRARELTRAFCDNSFTGFEHNIRPKGLFYVCMTQYDATMPNVHVAFPPEQYKNTLGEYLAAHSLTQMHIAETEKYAHVTFFFNGGVEKPNQNEDRILIPSPDVATYDLQPEMSAPAVCSESVNALLSGRYDFIVVNFANADMVGHTGIFDAAVSAVETVDECVRKIYDAALQVSANLFITADHGNADKMADADGKPLTAHSTNPVPAILITPQNVAALRQGGILADIAPTLLQLMNLPQPSEMTGRSLIIQ